MNNNEINIIAKKKLSFISDETKSSISLIVLSTVALLISSYFFFYQIPHIDSDIDDINALIHDTDINSLKLHVMQQESWLPYNLIKLLDINQNYEPKIKESLANSSRIATLTMLGLLCFPDTPTVEQQNEWQMTTLINLEVIKQKLSKKHYDKTGELRQQRIELINHKNILQLIATIIQSIGMFIASFLTIKQFSKRNNKPNEKNKAE